MRMRRIKKKIPSTIIWSFFY